jgi:hypothetical protein
MEWRLRNNLVIGFFIGFILGGCVGFLLAHFL